MVTSSQLIACAEIALSENATKTASALLALIQQEQLPTASTVTQTELLKAIPAQSPLSSSELIKPMQRAESQSSIFLHCCNYIRSLNIGDCFSFLDVADHVKSQPGVQLDVSITTRQKRERWRNDISHVLEKMLQRKYLNRVEGTRDYVIKRHP